MAKDKKVEKREKGKNLKISGVTVTILGQSDAPYARLEDGGILALGRARMC